MEEKRQHNHSGITVVAIPTEDRSNRAFTIRRKGEIIGEFSVYCDGAIFIREANSVHIRNDRIKHAGNDGGVFFDINFLSFSGQES